MICKYESEFLGYGKPIGEFNTFELELPPYVFITENEPARYSIDYVRKINVSNAFILGKLESITHEIIVSGN